MRKRERLSIYKNILKLYQGKVPGFVCDGFCKELKWKLNIHHIFSIPKYNPIMDNRDNGDLFIRDNFPELWEQKPKHTYSSSYWYIPYFTKNREKCLIKAIKMIEQ